MLAGINFVPPSSSSMYPTEYCPYFPFLLSTGMKKIDQSNLQSETSATAEANPHSAECEGSGFVPGKLLPASACTLTSCAPASDPTAPAPAPAPLWPAGGPVAPTGCRGWWWPRLILGWSPVAVCPEGKSSLGGGRLVPVTLGSLPRRSRVSWSGRASEGRDDDGWLWCAVVVGSLVLCVWWVDSFGWRTFLIVSIVES